MDVAARVARLIAPTLESMGFELVRVRLMGAGGGGSLLQVMTERPDGRMTIDDCAEISRALSALLDVEDPIAGSYRLEISSPGIDRPLTRAKDFTRWAGHEAKIELKAPIEGRKRFRGRLDGLDGADVLIAEKDEQAATRLPLAEIHDAKLVLTDALIKAATGS